MMYAFVKNLVALIVLPIWRPRIHHHERIPSTGPVILASNHVSWADTVFMPIQISRIVHFLAKSELIAGRSIGGRLLGALMRSLHVMPVDRSGGSASRTAIEGGLSVLRRGGLVGIYPEGTRSPDGRQYRAKTGVARLALATDAVVIPMAMTGAFEASQGSFLPRRRPRIEVHIGEPVDVDAVRREHAKRGGSEVDAEGQDAEVAEARLARAVADEITRAIGRLSGQQYVDEYAAVVKARRRAAAEEDGPGRGRHGR